MKPSDFLDTPAPALTPTESAIYAALRDQGIQSLTLQYTFRELADEASLHFGIAGARKGQNGEVQILDRESLKKVITQNYAKVNLPASNHPNAPISTRCLADTLHLLSIERQVISVEFAREFGTLRPSRGPADDVALRVGMAELDIVDLTQSPVPLNQDGTRIAPTEAEPVTAELPVLEFEVLNFDLLEVSDVIEVDEEGRDHSRHVRMQ